ncbi:MAG: oligosaccharide flippase family protein [Clostridia bacterium]|nr:oligosaccharide flippase family protein [Clostridia bacterium]
MERHDPGRSRNIRRNFVSGVIQRAVSLLLPFVVRTIILYSLGEMYLGLGSLFTSVLQVLNLAELGVGSALIFSMYEPMAHDDKPKIRALLALYRKLYRYIGLAILVLGLAAVPLLPRIVKETLPDGLNLYLLYAVYLANAVLSYFFFAYRESLLNASQRVSTLNNIQLAVNILICGAQVAFLLLTKNYYLYCIVIVAGTILRNVFVYFATKRFFPDIEPEGEIGKEQMADIKKRTAGMFCYRLCSVTRNSFDTIILTAFLGLVIAGRYNNYFLIYSTLTGFLQIISASATASVGNSIVLESQQKNHDDFEQLILLTLWIAGACMGCLMLLYQPFMTLWAGPDKLLSEGTMIWISFYFFVNMLGITCATYRSAAGIWWEDRFRPFAEALLNPILNIILVRRLGVSGVVLSSVICLLSIGNIWGSRMLFKLYFTEFSQKKYLLKLLFYTLVTCFGCGLAYLTVRLLGVGSLLLRIPFAVLIPNTVFFLCYRTLPEFGGLMKRLPALLPNRIGKLLHLS